jgi:hypothetical protein
MRLLLTFGLMLGLWIAPSAASASHVEDDFSSKLYLVQKIYIGEMGNSDEAARFRLLLDDKLSKKGFIVVDKEEKADAILTGALSLRVYDDGSVARATVLLKSPNGERLWGGNFTPKRTFKRKDTVQLRAEDIADRLRSDWKKSAKAAGLRVDK